MTPIACELVDTEPPATFDVCVPGLETVVVPGSRSGCTDAVVVGAKNPCHREVRIRRETCGSAVAVAGAEQRRTVRRHQLIVLVAARNHHRGYNGRCMEVRARS